MNRSPVSAQCRSLFERLECQASPDEGRGSTDRVVASVAAHLGKMLSTRAGSVQTLPDYGLPDLNDMRLSLHESLSQARFLIERFIQAYEPRLNNVRVTALPRDRDLLALAFAIEGALDVHGVAQPVAFCARLDGSGQVKVN